MTHNGNSKKGTQHVIRLQRGSTQNLLPKDFFKILIRRFSPVMALVYLISVFCIAVSSGDYERSFFYDNTAYCRGLLVVLWCAGPAVVWLFLVTNPVLQYMAHLWFKILAALLQITICLIYLLFPEIEMYGMRSYLILSFPAFFFIYYFLAVDPLPLEIVYPLNALGICALIWSVSMESIMIPVVTQ